MSKILIVEDQTELSSAMCDWLSREDHETEVVADGLLALEYLKVKQFDVVVLDLMLPGLSGLEICRQYRDRSGKTPILMLTAKDTLEDKTTGLDSGADDYLTKPFQLKELSARIRALLRRSTGMVNPIITLGDLTLDPSARRLSKGGKELRLEPREFALLSFFMFHPNQLFSSEALLARVWSSDADVNLDTVRAHIKTLRRKIDTQGMPSHIINVHGQGYRFEENDV